MTTGVRDMKKLVQGVGINNGKYTATVDGKRRKEYALWVNMLDRCYNDKYQIKHPTYIGCTVSDNFKYYAYFFEWCQTQIGFNTKGYHLDLSLIHI